MRSRSGATPDPPSDEPIFVVGYQRSGTTLMQALLGAHPRIAAPPETFFLFRVALHAGYFGDLAVDQNLERALEEALNPPGDMLAEAQFDSERVLRRAKAGPRTYAGLFDAIMRDFADRHGKARWSEKSPGQRIDMALGLFPRAQIIHIVRDPRDVVASSLRTAWTDPDAAAIARSWRDFTLSTIRRGFQAGPGQFLQIRYEDLTRDPAAVLRVVCAFLGEPYLDAMWDDVSRRQGTVTSIAAPWQGKALSPVVPAQEGLWRTRLTRLQRVRVNALVASMLEPLGYEPTGGRSARLGAPPLRVAETLRAARERRRASGPPLSAEALYRLGRDFTNSRVERIGRSPG